MKKYLLLPLLLLAVPACTGMESTPEGASVARDDLRPVALPQGSFPYHLRDEYIALSDWEWRQQDYPDAHFYGTKARMIRPDVTPPPQEITARQLPTATLNELAQARNYLISALSRGAHRDFPQETATAQAKFDCWLEQQEENFQPDHIAMCRSDYFVAEDFLKASFPEQPGETIIMPEESFIVFFDFDKHGLTVDARTVLDEVIGYAGHLRPARIHVTGHADRAGPIPYNQQLSERRADNVEAYLKERGVEATFTTKAYGELQPRVQTADGVKEWENRYATITFFTAGEE